MKSLNKKKASGGSFGIFSCLATFEILTAFKDGHYFKEGQRGYWRFKIRFFAALLDYTCGTFPLTIWGKSELSLAVVAMLWLNRQGENSVDSHILLIMRQLRSSLIRERFRSLFSMNFGSLFDC